MFFSLPKNPLALLDFLSVGVLGDFDDDDDAAGSCWGVDGGAGVSVTALEATPVVTVD